MMMPLLESSSDPVDNAGSGDELVIAELWISFASLLRSHLAALQITGKLGQAMFSNLSASSFEVADLSRTLHLNLQSASGAGEWSLTRLRTMIAAGTWQLHPDATVAIDGGRAQDMELAVEGFVAKLWGRTDATSPDRERTKI
jgi:hypothetical protein